eukprot:UN22964
MSKQRMIVVLPDKIHIFDLSDMSLLHCLDTPPNSEGICDFILMKDKHFLAFPTSSSSGKVMVFDAYNLQVRCAIDAHESRIQCLKFSPDGRCLATASTKGTIIRISSVKTGNILYEFRRGSTTAVITCMSFSIKEKILAVTSRNNTIHFFDLIKIEIISLLTNHNDIILDRYPIKNLIII